MRKSPQPFERKRSRPAALHNVASVAKLRAQGYGWNEIAKKTGLTPDVLRGIRSHNNVAWQAAYDAAMQAVVSEVRQLAGTEAMLPVVGDFMAAAESAEQWTRNQGRPLFPLPAEAITGADGSLHTLSSFFERYYLPICLSDGSGETIKLYRVTLRKWAMLTGDPPLKSLTVETLARFRDALVALRKANRKKLNPITARNYLRHIQILLDKAGPRVRLNRDAAGFIAEVPWVKPIKAELPEPRIAEINHIAACYEAAEAAVYPKLPGVVPGDWWRALLAVTYNLGLRRRTLFGLTWDMVDWDAKLLRIPAAVLKGRKRLTLPMNAVVLTHLQRIKGEGSEAVFPWPHSREWFGRQFHMLQTSAGIMQPKQFGVHRIRKTCATVLWKQDRAAAQLMLGHAALAITQQHYVDAIEGLSDAVATMRQPAGFAT